MPKISAYLFGILFHLVFCGFSQNLQGILPKPNLEQPEVFLSQYLKIESVTGNEKEAGEFFANACRQAGLHVTIITAEVGSYNFAASLYPLNSGKPNIVFLTHIDVVPEGNLEEWTHPPYAGVIADGYVWGRGAIDNKGQGVMQFFALKHFVDIANNYDLPYNFTMLAVSNEEQMGRLGAEIVVNQFLEELNPIVVFGEGGVGLAGLVSAAPEKVIFGIETVQKKALWFNVETTGSSAGHGSVPMARYPAKELVRACNVILSLKPEIIITPVVNDMLEGLGLNETGIRGFALRNMRLISPLISSFLRNDGFAASLMTNTIVLTGISGDSDAHNQVAQNLVASFDSRLLPGVDPYKFLEEIEYHLKPFDVRLRVISSPKPSPPSEINEYYRTFAKAIVAVYPGAQVLPMLFPAVNDNRFFRNAGIPTFGITPALLSQNLLMTIHNNDERLPVEALHSGIGIYVSFIKRLIE